MNPLPASQLSRRRFVTRTVQAAAFTKLLSYAGPAWAVSPNEKLNIGCIGVANQGRYDLDNVAHENVAAICDVDTNLLNAAGQKYSKARRFQDFRKMLEAGGLDAVTARAGRQDKSQDQNISAHRHPPGFQPVGAISKPSNRR